MNEQMKMMIQIMRSPNKKAMLQSLLKQNPQLNRTWQLAEQMASNNNKQEVLNQIAQQKGLNINQINEMIKQFGINI